MANRNGLNSPTPEAIRAEAKKNVDHLTINGRTAIEPNGSHSTSPPLPPGALTPRTRRNSKVGISSLYRADLPKLPVPGLRDSMSRYLRALEGLQDQEEHEQTKEIVREFLESGEGDKWQARLEEYAQGVDSYIEEFWCEYIACGEKTLDMAWHGRQRRRRRQFHMHEHARRHA